MDIKDIVSRVRWNVVLGILGLLFIFVLILLFIAVLNPLAPKYKEAGNIGIRSWAEPDRIEIGGTSMIWIDVKNSGKENIEVDINLETYDPKLTFADGNQTASETINVGPGESRKLGFNVELNASSYAGKYGVEIIAKHSRVWSIDDEVYITGFKK